MDNFGHTLRQGQSLTKLATKIRSHSLDKANCYLNNFGHTLGKGQSLVEETKIHSHSLDRANHYFNKSGQFQSHFLNRGNYSLG